MTRRKNKRQTFPYDPPTPDRKIERHEREPHCMVCDDETAAFDPWYCETHSRQHREVYRAYRKACIYGDL